MEECFDRREKDFIGEQTDDNDHKHDRDDLIHRTQLAAVMEKLAEAEAGKDRHENFRCHERAPCERPTLLHAADDEGKRGWQDNLEPHVQAFGPHGQRGAAVNWRNVAYAGVGCDDHRPERSHDNHEEHGRLCLTEP